MIKNSYSFWGYLRLAIFVIRTKFISSKARIIRFPIYGAQNETYIED